MPAVWVWRAAVVVLTSISVAATPLESRVERPGSAEPHPAIPRGDGFLVVVNEQNAVAALPRTVVSRFFLKKVSRWDSGAVALPVDLPPDSPVRDAFSRRVLSKSVSSIKAYWQQQIFSGRDVPPPEKADDAAVLEFVMSNPAAIAYVSSATVLPRGVRALNITD
jgi:ABC-type phosphate transport system substrate-binding protein